MSELTTLLQGGAFFEAPRWRDGLWWVSDFYAECVLTVDPGGNRHHVMRVAGQPAGLGWMPDGSLLVVSRQDRQLIRRTPQGEMGLHADLAGLSTGALNDMVVDRHGRAYVGEFGFDLDAHADPATAAILRVDPDGSAGVAADQLGFPNGMVITPDGSMLIVAETMGARFSAFAIAADGSLGDRRVWGQVTPAPPLTSLSATLAAMRFGPDGCALDAEGYLWAADLVGRRCVRLAPGGGMVAEIAMPEDLNVFACMLGGQDGRTLLMCAAPDFDAPARAAEREAVLLTTTVDVPHAGLP